MLQKTINIEYDSEVKVEVNSALLQVNTAALEIHTGMHASIQIPCNCSVMDVLQTYSTYGSEVRT